MQMLVLMMCLMQQNIHQQATPTISNLSGATNTFGASTYYAQK